MQMHGPRGDRAKDRDIFWRIKAKTSDELRQEFLSIYVPRIWELGLTLPDPDLRLDETTGHYVFGDIDWSEFFAVLKGNGPCNAERIEHRRRAHDEGAWVRDAAVAYADKQATRRTSVGAA